MDGYELASRLVPSVLEFVGKLTWPGLVCYVAVTQRDGIKRLLERLSKVKAGGVEAEFGQKAAATAEKIEERVAEPVVAPQLPPDAPIMLQPTPPAESPIAVPELDLISAQQPFDRALAQAYIGEQANLDWLYDDGFRTSGAIIEQWSYLNQVVRSVAINRGISGASTESIGRLLQALHKLGVISTSTANSVKDLQKLRNQVAHSQFEPTKTAGDDFVQACQKVIHRIWAEDRAWLDVLGKAQQKEWEERQKIKE